MDLHHPQTNLFGGRGEGTNEKDESVRDQSMGGGGLIQSEEREKMGVSARARMIAN